jgi:hypothetical protein
MNIIKECGVEMTNDFKDEGEEHLRQHVIIYLF